MSREEQGRAWSSVTKAFQVSSRSCLSRRHKTLLGFSGG